MVLDTTIFKQTNKNLCNYEQEKIVINFGYPCILKFNIPLPLLPNNNKILPYQFHLEP